MAPDSATGDPELLERHTEQAAIAAVLQSALQGAGGLVVLQGPAGIGKTRLLSGAQTAATDLAMLVGRARGGNLEQDFAFGAVRQLFEPLVARAVNREHLFAGAAQAAAPILGFGDPTAPALNEPGVVLHGLYWLTVALAESQPVALICDDAHWFDGPSLRFIAYLANRVAELPVAIVLGTRPPEPGPEGELLARIIADQATMQLAPGALSDAAVAALVRLSLDDADGAFCQAVAEASRGNPFLVGELIRSARAAGVTPDAASAAALTELSAGSAVLGRLGRLPAEALELARAVAVLGADADLRHAAALAGLDIDRAGAAADTLLRADVLGPDRPLAFVHPLVATAVYNDLLPGDRSARHRRAAKLLLAESASPDRIATHLLITEPAGDADVVELLTSAARPALAQGAADVAIAYLRRALAEPPAAGMRLGVLLELGVAEASVTSPDAMTHLGEAIQAIEDPATRVMLAMANGVGFALDHRPSEAIAAFDALEPNVASDPDLSLQLLAGAVLVGMTGPDATPLVADRIAKLCDIVDATTEAAPSVLGVRSFVGAFGNEPSADMADLAARSLAALSPDDPTVPVWFHLPLVAMVMADRDREAATIVEEGLAIARRLAAPAHLGVTLFMRAWIALRAGELDDAEADARAALEVLKLHDVAFVLPGPLAILVDVLRERDDLAGADALLNEWGYATGDGDSLFHLFLLNARAHLRSAQERYDEAEADLLRGLERTMANGCVSPGFIPWHAHLAMSDFISRRITAKTRANVATALELADAFGAPRARAEALRAAAWIDTTSESANEAARLFNAVGAKLEEARTVVGVEVSGIGKIPVAESRSRLTRAFELADHAGSTRLSALIRKYLSEVGAEPGRRAATGIAALTPSERRVAALAAAGLTNKDVAQELFVTVKTVETHLAHTYQKLGITSRGELGDALSAPASSA